MYEKIRLGIGMCGSFCCFGKACGVLEELGDKYDMQIVMSAAAAAADTRFGKAEDFKERLRKISGKGIIEEIWEAEPIGPKKMFDVLAVFPCTGNTLAKIASGIADTAVTLAVKAHLRNERPVVIAVATNDGLAGNFKNIGLMMNRKNIYFVPFGQDDSAGKPMSLVADFEKLGDTVEKALQGRQIQPVLL